MPIRHVALTYACNRNCTYCYANALAKKFPDMNLENFKKVIKWFDEQNIHQFSLIGGEPTIHKEFKKIIKILKEKNFKAGLLTNLIFDPNRIDEFDSDVIMSYFINYSQPTEYLPKQKEILENNLKNIRRITSKITLRINFPSNQTHFKYLIDACIRHDINSVSYAITAPSIGKTNVFTKINEFQKMSGTILNFIQACKEQGIKPILARPIPFCLFTKEERKFIKINSTSKGVCGIGSNVYLINPDLSVFPCVGLHVAEARKLKITEIKSEREIFRFYQPLVKRLKWKTFIYPKCPSCKFSIRKQCQGVCLAYKY